LRKPAGRVKRRLHSSRKMRMTGPDCFLEPARSGRFRRRCRLPSDHTHR
jgi:hypothetical protein